MVVSHFDFCLRLFYGSLLAAAFPTLAGGSRHRFAPLMIAIGARRVARRIRARLDLETTAGDHGPWVVRVMSH